MTPKIPGLRLQLLLYTNMGADALSTYLNTTHVATRQWKLGIERQQNTQAARLTARMAGWGILNDEHGEHQQDPSGGSGDEGEEQEEAEEEAEEEEEGEGGRAT